MPSEVSYLVEWARYYAKHKDAHSGSVSETKEEEDRVIHKSGSLTHVFISIPSLSPKAAHGLPREGKVSIVTFNTKQNMEALISSWKEFATHPNLTVIFVNPLSSTDIKWSIKPHVHNQYTDSAALGPGIKSIASNVETLHEKDIKKACEA